MVIDQVAAGNVIEYEAIPLEKSNISRGLTAGSFGILDVDRGNQRIVVRWNGLLVLLEALDIARDRVLGHFLCFGQSSPVRHATRQRRYNRCESAFRFRPKHNVEMSA